MNNYEWLKSETAPRHLVEAVKLIGTKEIPGAKSNAAIMGWAKELGIEKIYLNDDTPWCGLFMGVILLRAGREPLRSYNCLRARDWAGWGLKVEGAAELADILVFQRAGGGHVGLYVGEDETCYHVLGGNQNNQVRVDRIERERCVAVRRPAYNNKPANIRAIALAATGSISTNEA